ncbi:Glucose-1-phosphate thymidylyltransferase [Methylophaga frappieri]|uniref:Glucose-1-phosphate thymidylyltransferase n=2 Tax=Methylophaga frappieri (strain ATCC BAA-2434 / DSM 25690 / JAM7) TaxID=754477 RepID=I1YLJ0_METFJ|nr:Glucose-1-phosphate thymidylyltransferase [Methylophaga frappieri]
MILAAGRGERLRPLTDHTPKPLLLAGNKPLIVHLIQQLVSAGFNEIVINHAHLGEQFPAVLGDGHQWHANLTYSAENNGGLETAGGIIHALPILGSAPFLVVNGDIWTDYPFRKLRHALADNKDCHLILTHNPAHHPDGDFALTQAGLLDLTGDKKYTYSGIGVYHPRLFAGLDDRKRPLKPLLLEAIATQRATGAYFDGTWSDIGTVERLEALNRHLLSRNTSSA